MDGPFVNLTLHLNESSTSASYCLSRSFNSNGFQSGQQTNLDECFNTTAYEDAFECYQVNPYTAGHSAVGGTPWRATLLHALFQLGRLWWTWQQANLTARLTEMGGRSVPLTSYLDQNGMECPSDDYDSDDSNVSTLNHNLWMIGVMPNATIREVMDFGDDLICAEYV
ncbi:hypothetical protein QQZ08_002482 [Neonectria magnoliae]|uniref:Uncharacterized protein n=1 Tax=Neonectria magnoliae TaxID=2732573 RepID=A0ABR1IDM6_9HYPO